MSFGRRTATPAASPGTPGTAPAGSPAAAAPPAAGGSAAAPAGSPNLSREQQKALQDLVAQIRAERAERERARRGEDDDEAMQPNKAEPSAPEPTPTQPPEFTISEEEKHARRMKAAAEQDLMERIDGMFERAVGGAPAPLRAKLNGGEKARLLADVARLCRADQQAAANGAGTETIGEAMIAKRMVEVLRRSKIFP